MIYTHWMPILALIGHAILREDNSQISHREVAQNSPHLSTDSVNLAGVIVEPEILKHEP